METPTCGVATSHSTIRNPQSAFLLESRGLFKAYRKGAIGVPVLQGVDLVVQPQEMLAIVGQSGSGKSTLLHLLGTLDQPDDGELYFDGHRIDTLGRRGRDMIRNRHFGMIFQAYHLLPELSAMENVLMPSMIRYGALAYWAKRRKLRRRADELLELVGLDHRRKHKPRELSGGEMQRTAIARALMNEPRLLLADEPTGNLDRATSEGVLELLRRLNQEKWLNQEHGLTVVMVTHDQGIAAQADRTVTLVEGRIDSTEEAGLRLQA